MRGFATAVRRPFLAFPIDGFGWSGHTRILPPDIAFGRQGDIGENAVAGDGVHRVRIGFPGGAGCDAEKARLGIHRVETPVGADSNPGNVVPDAGRLPSGQGGLHHGKIGLAAGAGERSRQVMFSALGRSESKDQHVLRHPAFFLRDHRGDAQGETFFPQQGIAAVAGPVGPDRGFSRKMNDVFFLRVRLARPRDVLPAGAERRADGMEAGNEPAMRTQFVEHRLAHARHDAHVDDDVG